MVSSSIAAMPIPSAANMGNKKRVMCLLLVNMRQLISLFIENSSSSTMEGFHVISIPIPFPTSIVVGHILVRTKQMATKSKE
ncbi:hypothetical protein VNO78_21736 [Psophocarpus tetragonolobus]|uniref:Uncharacterized protein n=1 Tax=Psophocarpus tetragonolobus TaxID=3891 RepID=A0AAN9SGY7_PSOTE